jgi:meromycolic acid enoyl-[acyl-carrier-protein] reductase
MGILEGKNILVAGVTLNTSIGFEVARQAQLEGATVVVSNFGRALSLTRRVVQKLDPVTPVLDLDVTNEEQLSGLVDALRAEGIERLDGVVHSIAFANPERALGGAFLSTEWDDVATSMRVSAYSYAALAMACKPLFGQTASVVGLTFDATVSWPAYDWMGVSKAALESTSRYLARYLGKEGVRSNLVAAGPLQTIAKKAIPGASTFDDIWAERAPLGWDPTDLTPTARAVVALLSDYFGATTGEMIHVDGGVHAMGA